MSTRKKACRNKLIFDLYKVLPTNRNGLGCCHMRPATTGKKQKRNMGFFPDNGKSKRPYDIKNDSIIKL